MCLDSRPGQPYNRYVNSQGYNRLLLIAFVALLLGILVKGYVYIFVRAEYPVRTYFSCDPEAATCFTADDEEFYAYGTLPAKLYRACHEDESCDLACEGNGACEIEYCTPEAVTEEEWCSEPSEPEVADEEMEEEEPPAAL